MENLKTVLFMFSLMGITTLISSCEYRQNDQKPLELEKSIPTAMQTITTEAGKEFTVELPSNRSTGFSWQLAQPIDKAFIQQVSSQYKQPEHTKPGAMGTEIWTFKGLQEGKANIMLEYKKVWEKDKKPAKVQNITVVIE